MYKYIYKRRNESTTVSSADSSKTYSKPSVKPVDIVDSRDTKKEKTWIRMRMRELRRGGGRVEECEVYYTMRRKVGKVARGMRKRDAEERVVSVCETRRKGWPSLFSIHRLVSFRPSLPPSRVSGSFSVAATPSGPAVTLASTTISTERGRRYSVSVLVEPPTPTQR